MIDDSYDFRISENILVSEIPGFNDQFDILFNQLNLLGIESSKCNSCNFRQGAQFF